MKENWKKYLVEFIGTFFLVFTIGAIAFFWNEGVIAPLAIGFVLMVMVYAGGHVSGGHYNPAVSLAVLVRGAMEEKDYIPYALFQIAGALCASGLVLFMSKEYVITASPEFNIINLMIAEFLFTFALCYVVLFTATSSKVENNSYYGLAIGSTVMVGAFAVGSICLGAFNPAVAISTMVLGIACCTKLAWITFGINLLAGAFAGWIYKIINND
ncbi:aquaporin [bacterium]|nr:aquaporin [bacterium]